eukprot:g71840.t1
MVDEVLPEGVAAVIKKCTVRNLKAWLTMHMGGDHHENKPILVARVMAHYSQCNCDRQRLSQMAQGGGRGRRRGRGRGRRDRGRGRGRGGDVQAQGRGRGGRRARASASESSTTSSSDENALLLRRQSQPAAPLRRPRRKIQRMIEVFDEPGYWDRSGSSLSNISSLSSDLDEEELLETSSRPKSAQRIALRQFIEASDSESDTAVLLFMSDASVVSSSSLTDNDKESDCSLDSHQKKILYSTPLQPVSMHSTITQLLNVPGVRSTSVQLPF